MLYFCGWQFLTHPSSCLSHFRQEEYLPIKNECCIFVGGNSWHIQAAVFLTSDKKNICPLKMNVVFLWVAILDTPKQLSFSPQPRQIFPNWKWMLNTFWVATLDTPKQLSFSLQSRGIFAHWKWMLNVLWAASLDTPKQLSFSPQPRRIWCQSRRSCEAPGIHRLQSLPGAPWTRPPWSLLPPAQPQRIYAAFI